MSSSEDSTLDGLYRTLAYELDDLYQAYYEIEESNFIYAAEGESLDRIGELFDVDRLRAESDDQYRLRIITRFGEARGAGTIPEISQAFSQMLDVDETIFELSEPDDEVLVVEFVLDEFIVTDSEIDEDVLFETLDRLLAAGVTLEGVLAGSFEFSESEIIEDSERGFSQLTEEGTVDTDIGGRWSYVR